VWTQLTTLWSRKETDPDPAEIADQTRSADLFLAVITQDWLSSRLSQTEIERFCAHFSSPAAAESRLVLVKASDVENSALPPALMAASFTTLSVTGEALADASWIDIQAIGEAIIEASQRLERELEREHENRSTLDVDYYIAHTEPSGISTARPPSAPIQPAPSPQPELEKPNYAERRVYFATDRAISKARQGSGLSPILNPRPLAIRVDL
jgi:hypothetical protein